MIVPYMGGVNRSRIGQQYVNMVAGNNAELFYSFIIKFFQSIFGDFKDKQDPLIQEAIQSIQITDNVVDQQGVHNIRFNFYVREEKVRWFLQSHNYNHIARQIEKLAKKHMKPELITIGARVDLRAIALNTVRKYIWYVEITARQNLNYQEDTDQEEDFISSEGST